MLDKCMQHPVLRWAPVAACFLDEPETQSPPIIRHTVRKTCCCCGGCVGFMCVVS
jgi:hypothetical protein